MTEMGETHRRAEDAQQRGLRRGFEASRGFLLFVVVTLLFFALLVLNAFAPSQVLADAIKGVGMMWFVSLFALGIAWSFS
jgi:hypothetical protein